MFKLCLLQELPTGSKVGIDPWLITHGKILAPPIVQYYLAECGLKGC